MSIIVATPWGHD